jgi:HD superfamily phosphodiesterase
LQDADKVDGLGAIGLVRAYTSKSHLFDYEEGAVIAAQGFRHAKTISEQIAFQMEWSEMLYTNTAKAIALQRFNFMQSFMEELQREVNESIE